VKAWSTPDLSNVTHVIKGLLESAVESAGPPPPHQHAIKVYCDSPEAVRHSDGHCHLTIYLLHVGRDPFWRNAPVEGPRPQTNASQPLSLNLSYLLTSWCDKNFASEQRAMSIALRAIHGHSIVTPELIAAETPPVWLSSGEFTMSIEADSIEEMSRLWQAFTVPMRLSALIKVGVIFVDPASARPPPAIPPSAANLAVSPFPSENARTRPMLYPGFATVAPPAPADADPGGVPISVGPPVVVGDNLPDPHPEGPQGGLVTIAGNGLDLALAGDVYLSVPGKPTEWKVTAWRLGVSAGSLTLLLPNDYADPATTPPPAATPPPGLYNLAVGSGTWRSNTVSLAIAPRIDGVTNPPTLAPDGTGLYAIAGAGFAVGAATKVSFGATALQYTPGAPIAGQFAVDAAGKQITFRAPNAATQGAYPIPVSVNGVAATTGWVATRP
jgi:hypothetical protein